MLTSVITYSCVHYQLLFSSYRDNLSAFAPRIVIFLTNESAKPEMILMRLGVDFGDKTLSWILMYGWRKSLKVG